MNPHLVELAFVSYLQSAAPLDDIPREQIVPALERPPSEAPEDEEPHVLQLPAVIVSCADDLPADSTSGNRIAIPRISLRSHASDSTRETHKTRVDALFAALTNEDTPLFASLSAYDGFTCFYCFFTGSGHRIVGQTWENFFQLRLMYCPSKVL
jgi:hypothetical protein